MLESDWLTKVLRCAFIIRETLGERSSRQLLTALQSVSFQQMISVFQINTVNNRIKTTDYSHLFFYVLLYTESTSLDTHGNYALMLLELLVRFYQ